MLGEGTQIRANQSVNQSIINQSIQTKIRTHRISFSTQASLPSDYKIQTFFDWPGGGGCLVSVLLCDKGSHLTKLKCLDAAFHGLKTGSKQVQKP